MGHKTIVKYVIFALMFALSTSPAVFAENADYVDNVSVCGPDVLIEMHNAGWIVVRESDIGKDNLDDILSVALDLLKSEMATGYFDPGDPIEICGIENVRPIITLEQNRQE